ncbi:MAG: oligoendopeptidase F [Alphaproteobacteria bacterium CG11_big_fil_rev_8_21_14_0_20_44_7]|nr:MAG: oligoendopeptidase F [Alphaproteobacteria bacterium CG11_big_fil_rev_8_21_14_0_20_44_7]
MNNLPIWDLSDLYPAMDSPEVKNEIAGLQNSVAEFCAKYDGKIQGLGGDELGMAVAEYEDLVEISQKLGSYAGLMFAGNMLDDKISAFYQDISEKLTDISSQTVFFTLALNRFSSDEIAEKLNSPKLAKYKPWIEDLRVMQPYQLSDELERFDLDKSTTSNSAWVKLFDETHANLQYDFDGEKLGNAEIFDKMKSKDRAVREKAAHAVAKTLKDNIKLFAAVTNNLAKDKAVSDKWRKFPAPISDRNIANLVEDEVVDALISTVKANYKNLSHRYYKYKAARLGFEKLEYWDRNAPYPEEDDSRIPYDEAVALTLDAYGEFSPKMREIGQKFFDNPWIDVPPRKGKDSGAFAHPVVPSAHPYLLLNYQGKINDVMTLAHELGHGVHQYLAREQGALICDTPLTLAETASVFGEQLVFRKLLAQQENDEKRKLMIASKVEDMLNTVIRQIAFCDFERKVHDARRKGEISPTQLGEFWMESQSESLGDIFNFADEYNVYWSYIPHFIHTPFYVYAYAFGDCLVNSLYSVYQQGLEGFEQKYIEMLKAGGSLRHKELLKPFGLDATKPDFWQRGLDVIDNFISELEKP